MTAAEEPVASPPRGDDASDAIRDGGGSADHAHRDHEGSPGRYVRLRRPYRRLSTGGIVVSGALGDAYLLEPGAELLWDILETPQAIDEIVTELERLERRAEALAVAETDGASSSHETTDGTGSGDLAARRAPRDAALALIEQLRGIGVVDVV